jgi:hypothetical protein
MIHLTIWRFSDLANAAHCKENGKAKIFVASWVAAVYPRAFQKTEIQMLKSIIAVVVGYIVMAIFSFAAFSAAYLGLGVERVFEAESYDISTIWMVVMVVLAFIGGIVGGFICAAISKSKGACMVFAGIVLALGLIAGIMTKMKDAPDTARTGDVPNLQAMQMAQTPTWICVLNPILGAVGVLLGARKKLPAV